MSPRKSPTASVFRKGAEAAPSGGGEGGKFLKVPEGESISVVPLVNLDDLVSIDQHEFWDINPALLFPCIGAGCPACEAGNKPKYKAFLPVLANGDSTTPKIYAFGISVERQLETIAEEVGEIQGLVLKIRRTGSGFNTRYSVVPTGKKVKIDGITAPRPEDEINVLSSEEIANKISAVKLGSKAPAAKKEFVGESAPTTEASDWDEVA